MHSYKIFTRTLPPTETIDKRVAVDSEDGTHTVESWDQRYDAPEVHENAARRVAVMENPNQEVTMQRVDSTSMGYTFRAVIGRAR